MQFTLCFLSFSFIFLCSISIFDSLNMVSRTSQSESASSASSPSMATCNATVVGGSYWLIKFVFCSSPWLSIFCNGFSSSQRFQLSFFWRRIPIIIIWPDPSCYWYFDPTFWSWNRCNMLIYSWILSSVSPLIAQSILFMKNTVDVWNDLKKWFAQGEWIRISEWMQEIYALQKDSKCVTTFYWVEDPVGRIGNLFAYAKLHMQS